MIFFIIVESFYNANKLALNSEKSRLLVSCKGVYRNKSDSIILVTNKNIVRQCTKMRVLGYIFSNSLDNQPYINEIILKVNFCLSILKEVFKYSNFRTKNLLSTSIILPTFRYASPLLVDSTKIQLQTLQTLLLKTTHPILGYQSLKWSTFKILDTL